MHELAICQALIEQDGRRLDRLDCADGTHLWFDIGQLTHRPAPAGTHSIK